jgi:hypothetical protein
MKRNVLLASSMADTFCWCESCWIRDKTVKMFNDGGECCGLKKKRPAGKECEWWIMDKEGWDTSKERKAKAGAARGILNG